MPPDASALNFAAAVAGHCTGDFISASSGSAFRSPEGAAIHQPRAKPWV